MIHQNLRYTQTPKNENNQMVIERSNISGNVTGIDVGAGGMTTTNLSMQITNTVVEGNVIGVSARAYRSVDHLFKDIHMILDGNTRVGSEGNPSEIILGQMNRNNNKVNVTIRDNSLKLSGNADISHAKIWAYKLTGGTSGSFNCSNNRLIIDGWCGGNVSDVRNFDTIQLKNVNWTDGGTLLNITDAQSDTPLADTTVDMSEMVLQSGTYLHTGETMTLIANNGKDTGLTEHNLDGGTSHFLQGVTTEGTVDVALEEDTNNLVGTLGEVKLNEQVMSIAENRTAAAAFLNQGADIAADSLDLLGTDYKYGLRTFGAVYGSRSTYDAAGDLKINGWSEIVGLGNVHRKGDGDLSWGIFYENGTGNYRTWNEFNNEMFRGDGSLLYNGGGAAVRYKQDDGWYYEASVRAGTLSASMDNAVKDGNGQSYGFDSDSTYWGAHAGVGKVIETETGEWNVYGKYFHTDIDGDTFHIDGDLFEFDSLTSDRLRLGARYTADKAKRWSLYYGLAWEYEFSGDSHMKAGQWDAPEQSLGGSTGIAEIGTVWQPDDSPWQANINLKGYAGEREGVSGMVQLAYTF